jgi:hypothetical protein
MLKNHFPNIYRVSIYHRIIYYLEDKADIAIRAFLTRINKRKLSYWELEDISKTFKSQLKMDEKRKIVNK